MNSKKIMVVEDDKVTQKVICDILQFAGYDVISASSAAEAVKLAREQSPDLITVDIMLTADSPIDAMDGLKVASWLKRLNAGKVTPAIIIISGIDPKNVAAGIAAAQPYTYLSKPVEKAKLLAAVEAALK